MILYKPFINVEKEYKKAPVHIIDKYNKEDKAVASELGLLDRMIFKTRLQKAFYTFKDHKLSFQNRADARLLNHTKTEIGKISKTFLENAFNIWGTEEGGTNIGGLD